MASMYGTIMDLPLFKGISEDQVSAFLEKTNIEFQNGILHNEEYLAGEFDTSFLEKKLIEWKE